MATPSKSSDGTFGVFPPADPIIERMEERMRRVEDDLVELRGVVANFGDIFVGGHTKPVSTPALPLSLESRPELKAEDPVSPKTWFQRFGGWVPFELFTEVSQIFRMYIDPRYRMRRSTQLAAPAIVCLFVANYFFFSLLFSFPVVSPILGKILDILLAILLYKVLVNELKRYREVLASFATWTNWRREGTIVNSGEEPHTPLEME